MAEYDYDMVVIGSGPAGQRAAVQAAKLGKRTAIVERHAEIGGVMVNSGTIPSKTLREAVIYLTGYRERGIYGESYAVKDDITMSDLMIRTNHVMQQKTDTLRHQLLRNRVELITADASFIDSHTLALSAVDGRGSRPITADKVVVAVGTTAAKPDWTNVDGEHILLSDDILNLPELPRSLAIIGGGVIGLEYGSIFATLGIRVTLIERDSRLLDFVDSELIDTLVYHLRQKRVTLRLNEEVTWMEPSDDERGQHVRIRLVSGKQIVSDAALYSIGRTGATASLGLETVGLEPDGRGRLTVNDTYQTSVDNIYAVGDVIGFPNLASTSAEQGRLASCHAFGLPARSVPGLFPYGIYTIPEISMVGRTEEDLTEDVVPYEVGRAQYREIARGQIIGDDTGLLKLLFHATTRKLLGVHIIGEGASELIHIGQAVLAFEGTVDYFVDAVFNYPTLAECYKTAALDGINRLEA
ncbi:MAG: Si-specific NAD(P)(+) transhydrogenase [Dehalococcoidia bacterium]|nr:Si-specific NAD(P)(+) transhydrogenase [Dehalococcoidia bacterium]